MVVTEKFSMGLFIKDERALTAVSVVYRELLHLRRSRTFWWGAFIMLKMKVIYLKFLSCGILTKLLSTYANVPTYLLDLNVHGPCFKNPYLKPTAKNSDC